jgi:pyruvate,water dikinase
MNTMETQGKGRFPFPQEVEIPPELEGWEEMYPKYFLFNTTPERERFENGTLWLQDKLHAPEAIYPLDLLVQDAWQTAISAATTRLWCIPAAQGWYHRVLGCYFYATPAFYLPPEDVMKAKEEFFRKRLQDFFFKEYGPKMWESWLKEIRKVGEEIKAVEIPKELPRFEPDEAVFPDPTSWFSTGYKLLEAFYKLVTLMYKVWHFHRELGPAYLASIVFSDFCKKLFPSITGTTVTKMVAGVRVDMFRPQEELAKLAKLAMKSPGVPEVLKSDMPVQQKMEKLSKSEAGKKWLREYNKAQDPWFYVSCGSGWFHYEGCWLTNPDVPFEYLKGYIIELEAGKEIERPFDELDKARKELVEGYRELITNEEDRRTFDELYGITRRVYPYTENHLFWCEHYTHSLWFMKMKEIANVLVRHGIFEDPDGMFLFNWYEIPEIIYDLYMTWAQGEGIPLFENWKKKAEKRRKILEAAKKWTSPPMLGIPPKVIPDPFVIMNYGVTDETVKEWLRGLVVSPEAVTELKGHPASPGIVEGPAKVVVLLDEITQVQRGEILVCRYTNPAWAPVFPKIKATVTDLGGLLTHAAIVSREYGIPAVVGTGNATLVIKTGDLIRVDGERGIVTIIKRVGQ